MYACKKGCFFHLQVSYYTQNSVQFRKITGSLTSFCYGHLSVLSKKKIIEIKIVNCPLNFFAFVFHYYYTCHSIRNVFHLYSCIFRSQWFFVQQNSVVLVEILSFLCRYLFLPRYNQTVNESKRSKSHHKNKTQP